MMTTKDKLVGAMLMSYGILKVFIGGTATFASGETKEKIKTQLPLTKAFYGDDETHAGKAIEFSFFLFGLFSLLHGLDKFKLLPENISHVLEKKSTEVAVYTALGVGLTAFYSAVIYTDLPITKIPANYKKYKLVGLLGGISFLLYPVSEAVMDEKKIVGSYGGVWNSSGSGKLEIAALLGMLGFSAKFLAEGLDLNSKTIHNDLLSLASIFANLS